MSILKQLGDVIAKSTNTNLCAHHRIQVAREVTEWLARTYPTPMMFLRARMALGEASKAGLPRRGDAFAVQYRATLLAIANEEQDAPTEVVPVVRTVFPLR